MMPRCLPRPQRLQELADVTAAAAAPDTTATAVQNKKEQQEQSEARNKKELPPLVSARGRMAQADMMAEEIESAHPGVVDRYFVEVIRRQPLLLHLKYLLVCLRQQPYFQSHMIVRELT